MFSKLVVQAVTAVKVTNKHTGESRYPIKSINVLKSHGQSSHQSEFVPGYVLQTSRSSQQMPTHIENARIACLDINLNKFRMQMGVQILVDDPANLEKIRRKEMDVLKERLDLIIKAGANVIVTTKGIDDLASKYMVEAKCIGNLFP
jgi:T-complex protein 1 subunit alpha